MLKIGPSVHREPAFWLMLLLATAIYLPRLTTLTIRGEESRRAVIAREMLETDDWIVPRTQGEVRLSRPPLQNWLIAVLALVAGEMTAWCVRLPGVITTVATVALVYWSARRTLSVSGAVVASAAYMSFFQVLEQGGTGETEPVFTLFVAASLLLWHGLLKPRDRHPWGLSFGAEMQRPRDGDPWVSADCAWIVGGACAGLAMLTKGLQAPLYFFGSAWAYLIVTRQFRRLFSRGHLLGIAAFAIVVGLWQAAFIAQMGLENGALIYFRNVAHRFHDNRVSTWIVHFVTYPLAVVGGCLLPWSVLLLGFFDPQLRARLAGRRDQAVFLATCIAVCLPSVWLPPEARPRYFMPLFPCFAVLVGIAAELLCEGPAEQPSRLWTAYVNIGTVLLALSAVALPIASIAWPSSELAIPLSQAVGDAMALLIAVAVLYRSRQTSPPAGMRRVAITIAASLGLIHLGPIITVQQQRSENLPAGIAALEAQMPAESRLVSFDHVHHIFLYYFARPVERLPWPRTIADVPDDVDYFCVHVGGSETPELPFAWDEIASLSVDRNHQIPPKERIVIGRRRTSTNADVVQRNEKDRL